jgi:MraZ protein
MQEYVGRYTNILDIKGRINLPARFRDMTMRDQNGDLIFILTRGSKENIAVFPIDEWRRKMDEIETNVTDGEQRQILIRRINYYASYQKVDKQGRINIPAGLIEYAHLDKEVDVMGYLKRFEIWNPAKLDIQMKKIESQHKELSRYIDY